MSRQAKPVICSLSEADFEGRETAWHEFLASNVLECIDREDGYVFSIRSGPAQLNELRRLTELEATCCKWMNIDITEAEPLIVTITSESPGGKDVIAMLLPKSLL